LTLIVNKEERAVLDQRAAEHAPVLTASVVRLYRIAALEKVGGIELLVAKKLEHVALKGIATRLGGEIDDAAVEPAKLGRWAVALDLELLDGVDHREVRHLPGLRLEHGDAVVEILIRPRSPSVDARQGGIRWQRDSRDDGGEHDEKATVQR